MTRRPSAPLGWLGGLLAVYLIAPFVAGAGQVAAADWGTADWAGLGHATVVSLVSATAATALVTLFGIPLGYVLARTPGRAIRLLGFIVQLPLALPPLSSGVLLLFLLGYSSPIGRLTNGALTDSLAGIVLAEAFVSAPFLIIAARSGFAGLDPVLEDVAATLGHRAGGVFLRVSLPLAWRTILAGMLLTWLRGFGEFGATVMVAYHPYSLPVYTYVAFGSQGLPAMLPVLVPTLVAAIAVMAASVVIPRSRGNRRRSGGVAVPPMRDVAVLPATRIRPGRPLAFAFRRTLDGFTLDVGWRTQARRLAILGASGSGKSMTLRLIAGLDRVPAESLIVAGRDLSSLPPERRGIAYVPQNYGLFPHLTVARQLGFAMDSDPERARAWMGRLGLGGLEHRLPAALSLGQQQRVALARAFSRHADLLLLDEPFSALDAPLRSRLRRELRGLQADIDATTILVTHDPEEAFLLADELLILDDGQVLQAGPVAEVYARPAGEAVARLLGAENIGRGRAVDGNAIDIGGGVVLRVAGPLLPVGYLVGWAVRPEEIRLAGDGTYEGEVLTVTPVTSSRREVALRVGDSALRVMVGAGDPAGTGACRVAIDAAAVQVWPIPGSLMRN